MAQWLRLCASTAEGVGSIPGQGAARCSQKKELYLEQVLWH